MYVCVVLAVSKQTSVLSKTKDLHSEEFESEPSILLLCVS
jgi:hypothetical protein